MKSIRVGVPSAGKEYRIRFESGSLDRLGEHCRDRVPAHRWAVIADARVAELYGDRALRALRRADLRGDLFSFPPGEASKSREEWGRLTDALLEAGHGRDSAVVALGGGVTGDLAGFVAATFMRGLSVVQVPTTLLAMLDSSVGGKTGLDTTAGKNLVGAFHHPSFVLADPGVLRTLPRAERAAGLAEGVKAAAIADGDLFAWMEAAAPELLAGETEALARLIRRGVEIKARVVRTDPEERGRRAILNFGHTVGHALEALAGYSLSHGAAVAAGMRVEARLGEVLGISEEGTARRLAALLDACGHEARPEAGIAARDLLRAASADKKGRGGNVRCVLLGRIGVVARVPSESREEGAGGFTHPIRAEESREALEAALRAG